MSASNASVNTNNSSAKPAQTPISNPKKDEILTVQAEEVPRFDVHKAILLLEKANKAKDTRDQFKDKVDDYEAFGELLAQGVGFTVIYRTVKGVQIEFSNMDILIKFFNEQMDRALTHLAKLEKDLIDALAA